ncbi:MAG: hypothetical protein CMO40_05485 [Verrucomicrobiaceae bacterium]|nr:hypothetical protein [Verrucomicrobiaceae bacterium]
MVSALIAARKNSIPRLEKQECAGPEPREPFGRLNPWPWTRIRPGENRRLAATRRFPVNGLA